MIYIFFKELVSKHIKNLFQRLLRFKAVKGFNELDGLLFCKDSVL